jgi:hypothetical protein
VRNLSVSKTVFLGSVLIRSINQIGQSIKWDSRTSSFVLSRKGTVFDLYTPETIQDDFRQRENLQVLLKIGNSYLALDPFDSSATSANMNDRTSQSTLYYCKRKFDSISVSFRVESEGVSLWLRHSNSKLRVCRYILKAH